MAPSSASLEWTLTVSLIVLRFATLASAQFATIQELDRWQLLTSANLTFIGVDTGASSSRTIVCSERIGNTCGGQCLVYRSSQPTSQCNDRPEWTQALTFSCLASTRPVGMCQTNCDSCEEYARCSTRLEDGFCFQPSILTWNEIESGGGSQSSPNGPTTSTSTGSPTLAPTVVKTDDPSSTRNGPIDSPATSPPRTTVPPLTRPSDTDATPTVSETTRRGSDATEPSGERSTDSADPSLNVDDADSPETRTEIVFETPESSGPRGDNSVTSGSSGPRLPVGAIAGIALGSVVLLSALILILLSVRRRYQKPRKLEEVKIPNHTLEPFDTVTRSSVQYLRKSLQSRPSSTAVTSPTSGTTFTLSRTRDGATGAAYPPPYTPA